jgi:hypothetical protein
VAAVAMSFNYVVRSVGYSLGSATAALVGIGAMAITTLTSLALARRHSPETNP